jgi:hypothetical protein
MDPLLNRILSQMEIFSGLMILIKWEPGFSGKMFWTLEIPFKTGFTV